MFFLGRALCAGVILLLLASPAFASTNIILQEASEANANDSNLDGVWDTLYPGPLENLLAYNGGSTYDYRAAVEFDLNSIPSNATINSATLVVQYGGASGAKLLTLQFNGFVGTGTPRLRTFQTQNPVGPRYDAFGPDDGTDLYKVPAASFVQSLVNADNRYAGFTIENLATNQTYLGGYYAQDPPELQVTYTTPEPSSVAIICLLLPLGLRRHRRRQ